MSRLGDMRDTSGMAPSGFVPDPPPPVLSIFSGYATVDYPAVSGISWIASGSFHATFYRPHKCSRCGGSMERGYVETVVSDESLIVRVSGGFAHHGALCLGCANYNPRTGTLDSREDWIRDSVPLKSGSPWYAMADWCEEHGRQGDADHLRIKYL